MGNGTMPQILEIYSPLPSNPLTTEFFFYRGPPLIEGTPSLESPQLSLSLCLLTELRSPSQSPHARTEAGKSFSGVV